jgi:L-iditol 2-dehydrogenase
MKALVLKEYKKFSYEDVPTPEPAADEVLVAVKACGICGSDVHGMDGSSGRRIPPLIMGHEACGVIADSGSSSKRFKPGDRVTFDSTVYCGDCWFCRRGEVNLCDNRRVLGVSCKEYRRHGAFAQFVSVPERIVYRLPDNLAFEQAALVEAVSVAVHAVMRSPVKINDTAVVVGTGMIGLLVIQVLRQTGCRRIVAVDIDDHRLKMAKGAGADDVFNANSDPVAERVRDLTEGRGADLAFEVVGFGPTLGTAVESLRKGGAVVLVGNLKPQVDLPLQAVVTRQITLIGTCASAGEYPICLDLIARGKLDVRNCISATPPLEQGPEWFNRLYSGEKGLMKVVLVPPQ